MLIEKLFKYLNVILRVQPWSNKNQASQDYMKQKYIIMQSLSMSFLFYNVVMPWVAQN